MKLEMGKVGTRTEGLLRQGVHGGWRIATDADVQTIITEQVAMLQDFAAILKHKHYGANELPTELYSQ